MLINKLRQTEKGQAMTEFLICASFALVPLFLGISMLAKYIDIKQTAIQAARYEAWEYTVWYADDTQPSTGFDAADQPIKSTILTQVETQQRFFNNPGSEITTLDITDTDKTLGWSANPLWVDHTGMLLYNGSSGAGASLQSSEDTPTVPVVGDIINAILDVIDFAMSAFGSLLDFLGSSAGFTAINTDAYAKSTVSMQVAVNPTFINFTELDGTDKVVSGLNSGSIDFVSSAGVVSDGWNAGGAEHTFNQAAGAIPSSLFKALTDIPLVNTIWNAVAILAPELRLCNPGGIWGPNDKGSLWLGHVDIDAVHPDRLEEGGEHVCNEAGMCDFQPVVERSYDTRDCID